MEKYRDEVISQLRGCLLSVKGQCDLRQISRDFKMLIGTDIPYSKLGFRSLEDFILSIPSLTTTQYNGQLYVDAKPTSKSSHIVDMINKQKNAVRKSKPSFVRRSPSRPYANNSNNSYNSAKWKPNYVKKPYQSSTRPAAVSHNQFVNILSTHQRKPSQVSNRLVVKSDFDPQFLADKNRTDPKKPDYHSQSSFDKSRTKESQAPLVKSSNDSFEKHRRSSDVQSFDKNRKAEPDKTKNNFTTKPEEPQAIINKIKNDTLTPDVEPDNVLSKVKSRLNKRMANIQDTTSNGDYQNGMSSNFNQKLNIMGKENIGEKLNLSDVITRQEESNHVPLKTNVQANDFTKANPFKVSSPTATSPKMVTFEGVQKIKPQTPTNDYLLDLQNFASIQGLAEPCVKVIPRKSRKTTIFDCSIKIETHSFSSYPADFFDEELVKQHVAKKALDQLKLKYKRKQSLLISNDEDVRERIPPIVKSHANGVWKWQLEADYIEKFNEQLPNNWIEIIDPIPTMEITACLGKYVLRHCKPGEDFQKGTRSKIPLADNVSVPSNTVTFVDDQMVTAEVTCVVSAGEIWCRQIENSETEQFNKLCMDMDEYYSCHHEREKTTTIEVGGYYVAINDGVWCRVRVFEIKKDDISCFCIDYGDEWTVSRQALYQLKRNFATLEAQAFVCRLIGIEELYELAMNSEYLFNLLGKNVQVQHFNNSDDDSGGSSPSDPVFPAVLFDCEANVVVNEHIIYTTDLDYIKPSLKENVPSKVYVMHAEKDGFVYVTVRSAGYDLVMKILKDIENDIEKKKIVPTKEAITPESIADRLYFIKSKRDSLWYRAKVIGWRPDGKSQLLLVDTGKTIVVTLSEQIIYPLDQLGDVAHKLSSQAVKVRMVFKGNVPPNFVEQVLKLMPMGHSVLLKVVKLGSDDIPVVEFYKRSETDDVLFSVNAALAMTEELRTPPPHIELINTQVPQNKIQKLIMLNQFESPKRDNVPSSGSLPCPQFPEVGEFLDVTVPCAVNPFNFIVQPYSSRDALSSLMLSLQEKYKNCSNSYLKVEEVLPGQIYASKYEDGNWYRTSVIKVIHAGSISVFNCDYGNYANVTVRQLFPLDSQFTKLPYQAIKARMAGIEPKNLKWSVDDCNAFRKLIINKPYVSVLVSKDIDDLYKYDTVLSLKLIDTSTDNDVHVDQVLIDRGIAKRKV